MSEEDQDCCQTDRLCSFFLSSQWLRYLWRKMRLVLLSSTQRRKWWPNHDTLFKLVYIKIFTIKAFHFGPHRNSGPLLQKALLSSKGVLQKNGDNKSCRKTLDLKIWFSFFVHALSKKATELAKKVQRFHEFQSKRLLRYHRNESYIRMKRIKVVEKR